MTFEYHVLEAKKTLCSAEIDENMAGSKPASWYVASEEPEFGGMCIQIHKNAPCHAHLKINTSDWRKPIILASNCQYVEKYKEQSEAYLDWLFDPIRSPWRALVSSGFEKIYDDSGRIRGFFFTQEKLSQYPFMFFKNFCIAARVVYEHPKKIAIFKKAIDAGLSGSDAFILATYLDVCSTMSTCEKATYGGYCRSGWHWPICLSGCNDGGWFNYEAFTSGTPRRQYRNPNGCWTHETEATDYGYWKHPEIYTDVSLLWSMFQDNDCGDKYESNIRIDDAITVFRKWKETYVKT